MKTLKDILLMPMLIIAWVLSYPITFIVISWKMAEERAQDVMDFIQTDNSK